MSPVKPMKEPVKQITSVADPILMADADIALQPETNTAGAGNTTAMILAGLALVGGIGYYAMSAKPQSAKSKSTQLNGVRSRKKTTATKRKPRKKAGSKNIKMTL